MKSKKELFDLVDVLGEILDGELHIIETTDELSLEGEKSYRVYHKCGFCVDVAKAADSINEETGIVESWEFSCYHEWDGFNNVISIDELYMIIAKKK